MPWPVIGAGDDPVVAAGAGPAGTTADAEPRSIQKTLGAGVEPTVATASVAWPVESNGSPEWE